MLELGFAEARSYADAARAARAHRRKPSALRSPRCAIRISGWSPSCGRVTRRRRRSRPSPKRPRLARPVCARSWGGDDVGRTVSRHCSACSAAALDARRRDRTWRYLALVGARRRDRVAVDRVDRRSPSPCSSPSICGGSPRCSSPSPACRSCNRSSCVTWSCRAAGFASRSGSGTSRTARDSDADRARVSPRGRTPQAVARRGEALDRARAAIAASRSATPRS